MFGKLTKAILILIIIILGFFAYFSFLRNGKTPSTSQEKIDEKSEEKREESSDFKRIDFSQFNSSFKFAGTIPEKFEIEYIPQLKAVSIYDPTVLGESIREKSQIYITYFEASRFLTLSTVDILKREETSIKGHDVISYEIAKKTGVPDFPQQPSWRNKQHKALDIRFTKSSPSLFYPFAYNPYLSEEIFNDFIDSLEFDQ